MTAIQNRNLRLPENSDELYQIDEEERETSEEKLAHTNQFRYAAEMNPLQELTSMH